MKQVTALYIISSFIVSFFFYLAFCTIDIIITDPASQEVISISTANADNSNIVELPSTKGTVMLKPNQKIIVKIKVERYRSGTNRIERVVVQDDKVEEIIFQTERINEAGVSNFVIATYKLNSYIRGCGYVYSRNIRRYNLNVISQLFPNIDDTPGIKFCIKGE